MVLIILIALSIAYAKVNKLAKEEYKQVYTNCIEKMEEYEFDLTGSFAKECINKGGCYSPCGSACSRSKPYAKFSEIFSRGEMNCIAVCVESCIMAR